MKLGRLNHVGVATPSIEQSLQLYRNLFNAEPHGEPFEEAGIAHIEMRRLLHPA